ncbi:hypothetical protein DIPPA_23807 [Diplonema papillatum]|nr:hypothetical protein DIPPA_23807 [Diplonema papillatum]
MGTDHNDTILLFTFFLALTVWGTSLFESLQLPVLHFTVIMVAFGVACGGLVRLFYPDEDFTNETFNDGVFFRAILPPIIFAAGYSDGFFELVADHAPRLRLHRDHLAAPRVRNQTTP